MAEQQEWEVEAGGDAAGSARFLTRLRDGDTFGFLFLLLLASFTVAVVANEQLAGRIVGGVLAGAAPLVAFLAAKASRKWVIVAGAAFAATIIISVFGEWIDLLWAVAAVNTLHMIVLFWSVPIVLRRLLEHETVTFETVAGSICVYLLIGLAFANLYLTLSAGGADPIIGSTVGRDLPIDRGDFYYYSFISMLTVGFGDFVPLSAWGKALTALQAIIGQVVLLTLVARMVSAASVSRKWTRHSDRPAHGDPKGVGREEVEDSTEEGSPHPDGAGP